MRKLPILLALLLLAAAPPAKWLRYDMTADGLVDIFLQDGKLRFFIPRILIFDADGGLVANREGYGPASFQEITKAINSRVPKQQKPRIEMLAQYLRTSDGKPVSTTQLRGMPVIVELGAAWCGPCRVLESDLRRLSGVTVIQVDADMRRRQVEVNQALRKHLGK